MKPSCSRNIFLGRVTAGCLFAVFVLPGSTAHAQGRQSSSLSIELEDQVSTAKSSAGPVTRQDMRPFGAGWSGNAQLFWRPPPPVDQPTRNWPHLSLSFDAPGGTYEVVLHYTSAPDFGTFRVFLDGKPAGDVDGYAQAVSPQRRSLGQHELTSGNHPLVVTVFEKAGASTGFAVGLDRIELQPIGAAPSGRPNRVSSAAPSEPSTPPKPARANVFSELLPSGAAIWYQTGDVATSADFAAHGKSVRFYWDVSKIRNAQGVAWQVSDVHLPDADTSLQSPSLVRSGQGSGVKGSFVVDFGELVGSRGSGARRMRAHGAGPLWQVRVLPISAEPPTVVGKASNVIGVYDDQVAPSSGPGFKIDTPQWYTKPGIPLRLTRFEFVPYRYFDQWPSGCEVYKGEGSNETPWGWAAGAVGDAFDWTSQAYKDAKNSVVTGVVTVFPFVPREVAAVALDAALASCGIPPSIPNLNQLMTNGADYLAGQMTDELASQVPAGSALAQLGKEELRRRVRQQTREALVKSAKQIRDSIASKSKYCRSMEYPPYLKITVRNSGDATYRDMKVELSYEDMAIPPGGQEYLLRGFDDFVIDELGPGETLTIPVDIFSHMNVNSVPEDKTTSYSEKDIGHWMGLYGKTPFRFTVRGGQTLKYTAASENGAHRQETYVSDGTGFHYQTPRRTWMTNAFEGP
jgi:hypothetical protein